jgi:hypothetical protein
MRKHGLFTLCLSAVAAACLGVGQPAFAGKYEPAGDKVYHGASLPDTWSENGLATQVRTYQSIAGKRISVVTWFASTYENGRMTSWRQSYAPVMNRIRRAGALSLIKFSTQDYAYDSTRKIATTKQIAQGVYDAYFVEAAQAVKEFGGPIFISIDHEMNGTWYPYSEAYPNSGVTAADFVAAWQRIVNIFRKVGANNAAFVWSPNVPDVGPVPYTKYYPGDDYVDWIGVSFYSGNRMEAMEPIYRMYSDRKPFFITEWATAPEKSRYYPGYPGDAAWVNQVFQALVARYPRVKAISWFNWNKGDGNYLLQRVPDQTKIYAADIASPRYLDSPGVVQPNTGVEIVPIDRPSNEIILKEAPAAPPPAPVAPPVVQPRRERIRLQVVPTESVNVQR